MLIQLTREWTTIPRTARISAAPCCVESSDAFALESRLNWATIPPQLQEQREIAVQTSIQKAVAISTKGDVEMRERTNARVCFVRFLTGLALLVAAGIGFSGCSSNTHLKASKFAYVPNLDDDTISAYTIDSSTGALSAITGSPFQAGSEPFQAATDASGKFLFILNDGGGGSVSVYAIDASTGTLTEITGSPFAAPSVPNSVVVDPSSRFLFVGDFRGKISVFSLNSSTGALTAVAGSLFQFPTYCLPLRRIRLGSTCMPSCRPFRTLTTVPFWRSA
jgi:hypothetical protein